MPRILILYIACLFLTQKWCTATIRFDNVEVSNRSSGSGKTINQSVEVLPSGGIMLEGKSFNVVNIKIAMSPKILIITLSENDSESLYFFSFSTQNEVKRFLTSTGYWKKKGFFEIHLKKEGKGGEKLFFLHNDTPAMYLFEYCGMKQPTYEGKELSIFGTVKDMGLKSGDTIDYILPNNNTAKSDGESNESEGGNRPVDTDTNSATESQNSLEKDENNENESETESEKESTMVNLPLDTDVNKPIEPQNSLEKDENNENESETESEKESTMVNLPLDTDVNNPIESQNSLEKDQNNENETEKESTMVNLPLDTDVNNPIESQNSLAKDQNSENNKTDDKVWNSTLTPDDMEKKFLSKQDYTIEDKLATNKQNDQNSYLWLGWVIPLCLLFVGCVSYIYITYIKPTPEKAIKSKPLKIAKGYRKKVV